ncbi:MAG: transcriptional regulator, partial [Rubrivivax sp.]|nr:transcriptional regulator [Rubrivivax sp.]
VVVLICEEALENLVCVDILAVGAKGYTLSTVRGRGKRGVRDAGWLLSSNVRFEVMCSEDAALRLIEVVQHKYAPHYGLIIYMHDVLAMGSGDH